MGLLHSRRDDQHGALAFFESSAEEQALEQAAMAALERLDNRLGEIEEDEEPPLRREVHEAHAAALEERAKLDKLAAPPAPEASAKAKQRKPTKAELDASAAALAAQAAACERAEAAHQETAQRYRKLRAEKTALEDAREDVERTYLLGLETRVRKFIFAADLRASRAGLLDAHRRMVDAGGKAEDGFALRSLGSSLTHLEGSSRSTANFQPLEQPAPRARVLARARPAVPWVPPSRSDLTKPTPPSNSEHTPHALSRRHLLAPNGRSFVTLVEPNRYRSAAPAQPASAGALGPRTRAQPRTAPSASRYGGGARAHGAPSAGGAEMGPGAGSRRLQQPGEFDRWTRDASPGTSPRSTAVGSRPASAGAHAAPPHTAGLESAVGVFTPSDHQSARLAPARRPATAASADDLYADGRGRGYEGMPRPVTASALYTSTATQRVRVAAREERLRLPAGFVDVSGSLPTFNAAVFGFGSVRANPPRSLSSRPAWRPPTPLYAETIAAAHAERGLRAAQQARRESTAAMDGLAALRAGAAALAAEQAECREQLRVDARRKAARALVAARSAELPALLQAKLSEDVVFSALSEEMDAMLALLATMDAAIGEREPPRGEAAEPGADGHGAAPKAAGRKAGGKGGAKKPPPKPPAKPAKPAGKPKKGANEPAEIDVSAAADSLTDELVAFFVAAFQPAEAASARAAAEHDDLAHELEECRKDLCGLARVRASGILK